MPQRTIVEHWSALAEQYDAAKARNAGYYQPLLSLFAQHVPAERRARVLEVGCGTGQILASLNPAEGVGIDLSPAMIEHAKRRFNDREELTFHVLDAADTDAQGEYTAVISADLLEHVPDWRSVVRAMVRACVAGQGASGGVIVIATPNPVWAPLLWVLEKLRLKMPEGPHHFIRAAAVAAVLASEGCDVQHVGTHAIAPVNLFGFGPRFSHIAERLPLLNRLGVIQLIVARKQELRRDRAGKVDAP
jgi:2-polyprenyl-3-methyl-5-hydroxy-6-metoxy-1,4-benzoquinol methylase